ncbi:MAG: hypothetical protein A2X61_14165 [Ignavibacteria bacterium GWB2_35_12]|nr:MAG: hypothetical protein A2X61_14165 [Ignavibacteria bacterium GWB2_35_12]OGU96215.1 MAG: hypothetical protein A2220_12525 [Ignavibacteria bacterium RIFOXYA2_FULL_35_10]OGV23174.1 MAG: hypothetical protein A2475_17495 [Ignavibacteria bacterium RIFOXYC2_FULL_35_21]
MKRFFTALIAALMVLGFARVQAIDYTSIVNNLTSIDPEIMKYFPRWKICEPDLQIQVYRTFVLLGYEKSQLNMQNILVLASPLDVEPGYKPYDILLISCGEASMNSVEIEANMASLSEYINGYKYYSGYRRGEAKDFFYIRDYCYEEIKPEVPASSSQATAIMSYLEPTNVTHAFTLSLFEQSLKIGNSGFWLKSSIGTDEVGYHFWQSGEARVILKRPLYENTEPRTRDRIPYLINAYIGGGYRVTSGLDDNKSVLSWVTGRNLNGTPGGKLVAGLDFHMPFHPEFGIHFNTELPLTKVTTESIDKGAYGYTQNVNNKVKFVPGDPRNLFVINSVAPIMKATGQATLFYHWWLNEASPENYIRIDFGMNYAEVEEYAVYADDATTPVTHISNEDVLNLITYKPNEVGDWLYLKAEYRNQSAFPFGMSFQYSNQILLGRVYIPLLGQWFYLEGKYATPLRGLRPYEKANFFMISPVLRLTI